jgi:23S rRNA (guanine745-N1)-methyltransferase
MRKPLPGDTRAMLVARRTFLERGFYIPLAEKIAAIVMAQRSPLISPWNVLDAGCGEGYYLGQLRRGLIHHVTTSDCVSMGNQPSCVLGLDISKEAVRMAAKQYRASADFVVASIKEALPLVDQSIHVLLNIFAPRNIDEFARVLAPDGILLVVIPQADHLATLRTKLQLLGIEDQKEQHVIAQCSAHFKLVMTETVTYPLHLNQSAIEQVVMMTPNYWHLSEAKREMITGLTEMETAVSVRCLVFTHAKWRD